MEAVPVHLARKHYTQLVPGGQYAVVDRPSIIEAKEVILTQQPAILCVKLMMPALSSWSEQRQLSVSKVTLSTEDRLEFAGVIANGPRLVQVRVVFFGASEGHVQLSSG